MKNILVACLLVSSTSVANANDLEANVNSELAKVESEVEACKVVIATNNIIRMGAAAISSLSTTLLSESVGAASKWSAAMALGQIGNTRALSVLEKVEKTTTDSWLRSISQDAISMIKGEIPRDGKVYVYAFGIKKTKVDCEAGTSELIK